MSRRCQGPVLHGVPLPMHCPDWALPETKPSTLIVSTFVVSAFLYIQCWAKLKLQDELQFLVTATCAGTIHRSISFYIVRLCDCIHR